jgi:uncharacterized membrane protein HdeD (DUF308 family)
MLRTVKSDMTTSRYIALAAKENPMGRPLRITWITVGVLGIMAGIVLLVWPLLGTARIERTIVPSAVGFTSGCTALFRGLRRRGN